MHQRGHYGTSGEIGRGVYHPWMGAAEPARPPVRQVLLDLLAQRKKERQALLAKIQEDEKRLKVTFDLQDGFKRPFENDFLRVQFEALQNESSNLANALFTANKTLKRLDEQIQDMEASIAKATPPLPPPPPAPPRKEPPRPPVVRPAPPVRPTPPPPSVPAEPPVEERPSLADPKRSLKVGIIVAGAAVLVGGLLIGTLRR